MWNGSKTYDRTVIGLWSDCRSDCVLTVIGLSVDTPPTGRNWPSSWITILDSLTSLCRQRWPWAGRTRINIGMLARLISDSRMSIQEQSKMSCHICPQGYSPTTVRSQSDLQSDHSPITVRSYILPATWDVHRKKRIPFQICKFLSGE